MKKSTVCFIVTIAPLTTLNHLLILCYLSKEGTLIREKRANRPLLPPVKVTSSSVNSIVIMWPRGHRLLSVWTNPNGDVKLYFEEGHERQGSGS